MAGEPGSTRLLAEAARSWVDALGQRFGADVESQLIEAAFPLVDQYLKELNVAPESDGVRERYVARVVYLLAYHWWRFVEPDKHEDRARSSRGEPMAESYDGGISHPA